MSTATGDPTTSQAATDQTDGAAPGDQETYSKDEVANLLKALHSERDARKAQEKSLKESTQKLSRLEQINPDEYERLQQEAAKRAEFEAEFEARETERSRQLETIKAESAQREQKLMGEIEQMRQHRAFESLFSAAGGRGGRFLDTAFESLRGQLRLEKDGGFTGIDRNGDPVVDNENGRRVDPKAWIAQHKADEFLGFCFEPEQGYGSGTVPATGRRDTGTIADFKGLSTSEIFARTFGKRR